MLRLAEEVSLVRGHRFDHMHELFFAALRIEEIFAIVVVRGNAQARRRFPRRASSMIFLPMAS